MLAPVGAPSARGDGLRLAIAAGALLGSMSEAWWCPAAQIPGDAIDGEPMFRLILTERARPGCLLVNGRGVRFVDEAQNYNDLGRALQNFEPTSFSFPNVPAWLVFDGRYRATYRLGPLSRRDPDPDWLARGETPAELAARIGVPADALEATIARFNEGAARGEDPDFGRGTSRTTASSASSGRSSSRRSTPSRSCPAASARRAARRRTTPAGCSRSPTGPRFRASTPPATPPRARSASPTRAQAARSGQPRSSASGRARRPRGTDRPDATPRRPPRAQYLTVSAKNGSRPPSTASAAVIPVRAALSMPTPAGSASCRPPARGRPRRARARRAARRRRGRAC